MHLNEESSKRLAISSEVKIQLDNLSKNLLLDDEFWTSVKKLLILLKPLVDWIFRAESDSSKLGEVPNMFNDWHSYFEREFRSFFILSNHEEVNAVFDSLKSR